MAGAFLFNSKQEVIETIGPEVLLVSELTEEINGHIKGIIHFPYTDKLEEARYFGQKTKDNFYLYKIAKVKKDGDTIILDGIHVFFDELKGQIIRSLNLQDLTTNAAFGQILQNTGWSLSGVASNNKNSKKYTYETALTVFTDALALWGAEFMIKMTFANGKISKKEVVIADAFFYDNGKRFEYGDKLISVVEESNYDVPTAFLGVGATKKDIKLNFKNISWSTSNGDPVDKPLGQDYVEIKEATKLWGYPDGSPKTILVELSDMDDPAKLLSATYKYALENARPKAQMKAKAVSGESIQLGEVCTIYRPDIDIRYQTRVFKVKRNLLDEAIIDFEFGDKLTLSMSERVRASRIEQEKEMVGSVNTALKDFMETDKKAVDEKTGKTYKYEVVVIDGTPSIRLEEVV